MENKFLLVETLDYSVGFNKYIECEITYLNIDFIKSITKYTDSEKFSVKKIRDSLLDFNVEELFLIEFKTDILFCKILNKPPFLNY